MRKSAAVIPLLALAAGVLGFLIRRVELNTAFDTATGFAKRGAPVTLTLIAVSAAVVILAAVAGIAANSRMLSSDSYAHAFTSRSILNLASSFILGLIWLGADALYYLELRGQGAVGILETIFIFLAAVSAVSIMILARGAYKGRSGTEMAVFSVVPSVFFCYWLVLLYKNNASNPVILSYSYQCLALVAAALSFYFSAGYVFNKTATGRTLFSFLVTVYFCAVALADTIGLPFKLVFGVTAIHSLMSCAVFLRNLRKKDA